MANKCSKQKTKDRLSTVTSVTVSVNYGPDRFPFVSYQLHRHSINGIHTSAVRSQKSCVQHSFQVHLMIYCCETSNLQQNSTKLLQPEIKVMLLCHSQSHSVTVSTSTHMAIELWPEVLAIVVPSEYSPLVGSGRSKHMKGSKERCLFRGFCGR